MKIIERDVSEIGNNSIQKQILSEISDALGNVQTRDNLFIVNDTIWYWKNPSGKIMPTVVNSAKFITGRFQSHLKSSSVWLPEKRLKKQDVDTYKEFEGSFQLYSLEQDRFVEFLTAYERMTNDTSGPIATTVFRNYCQRGSPLLDQKYSQLNHLFTLKKEQLKLRVAIEFETGNVASSFRAANKLEYLYQEGLIDLGIFITANDKPNCAGRIWPVSNRNGSFQELEKRGFTSGLTVPLWQIGFEPDLFDQNAPYLSDRGETYELHKTNDTLNDGNDIYEIWTDYKGQDRLKRAI